jgi:GDP-L-fucose synthase
MPTNLYGPGDNFDLTSSHVLPALIRKFHLAALAQAGRFDEISADEKRFGRIPDDIMSDLERIKACGAKEGVTLWGTGRPMREFLFVDDLADGCLLVLRTAFDTLCRHGGQPDEILFNIGTGEDQSIRDLAAVAADVVGYRGKVAWNHDMPDGTPRKCLNVGRMHALGWRAGTVLREGIEKTVRWYRSRT